MSSLGPGEAEASIALQTREQGPEMKSAPKLDLQPRAV